MFCIKARSRGAYARGLEVEPVIGLRLWGLGFRVEGLGFRV